MIRHPCAEQSPFLLQRAQHLFSSNHHPGLPTNPADTTQITVRITALRYKTERRGLRRAMSSRDAGKGRRGDTGTRRRGEGGNSEYPIINTLPMCIGIQLPSPDQPTNRQASNGAWVWRLLGPGLGLQSPVSRLLSTALLFTCSPALSGQHQHLCGPLRGANISSASARRSISSRVLYQAVETRMKTRPAAAVSG